MAEIQPVRLLSVDVRGTQVLVDQADWESEKTLIVGHSKQVFTAVPAEMRWSILKQRHTSYVVAYMSRPKSVLLHRLIVECPAGKVCDHKNGNGLDNTRGNIRVATVAQNNANHRPRNGRQFAGVSNCGRVKAERWSAKACLNGKSVHIGTFRSEMEAVIA